MEKRNRKRTRKASEREEVSEEPSPPPVKARRRNSGGKAGEVDERTKRRNTRSRKKALRVSFDIVENSLSVGESEAAAQCTLTLTGSSTEAPVASDDSPPGWAESRKPQTVEMKFKRSNFTFSFLAGNKKRSWKSYKQIVTGERALQWRPTDPTFSSLDAPPPLKPAKKYSDLSGLLGKYRDPMSGLQFHSSEEFRTIRSLPPDVIAGYLALRGKQPIM